MKYNSATAIIGHEALPRAFKECPRMPKRRAADRLNVPRHRAKSGVRLPHTACLKLLLCDTITTTETTTETTTVTTTVYYSTGPWQLTGDSLALLVLSLAAISQHIFSGPFVYFHLARYMGLSQG
jgi:hypothetical protein